LPQNFKPKTLFEAPQVEAPCDSTFLGWKHFILGGALSQGDLSPRAIIVLGVHGGAFGDQKLCSCDVAVGRCPVQRRVASGGFSPGSPSGPLWASAGTTTEAEAPWEDEGRCGNAELCTRSSDKGTMNVLDSTSRKLFKEK